jgi:hypothetical protein
MTDETLLAGLPARFKRLMAMFQVERFYIPSWKRCYLNSLYRLEWLAVTILSIWSGALLVAALS